MQVTIIFHHEPVEPIHPAWWAESPEVPGFFAAREHFVEVEQVAEAALREALGERGIDPTSIEFTHAFAAMEEVRPA